MTEVNDAPTAANATLTLLEDGSKTFAASDFGFNDSDSNALSAVIITSLPAAGTLKLNGSAVTANQSITAADITASKLVFIPAANASGTGYASIGFKVQDNGGTTNGGVDTSTTANTLTLNVTAVNDAPMLSAGQLGMVTNLDVASNLVFTSQVALNLGTTGRIRILDQNTSGAGFRSDTNDNDQTIDLANAFDRGLITLSDGGKTITINPKWDLDLSSNYRIEVDKGAFVSQADNTDAQALAVDFSTVTPGNFNSNTIKTIQALSTSSSKMNDTGGMDADNRWWFDVERIGDIITKMTQLGDLSDKSYVLVAKNYATEPGGPKNPNDIYEDGLNGIEIQETHVGFTNFGANDQIYFDGQANNTAVQKFDSLYAEIYSNQIADGHLNNQNIFSFGTTFLQDGTLNDTGQAFIGLSLVGQTTYQKVDLLYAIPEFADLIGLDKVLGSAHPVIMA